MLNSADLELAPLALVVAPNGGGKSSLAHAVASVVLGNAVVIDGVKQSEIGQLIHAGAAKAELAIKGICFSGDLGPMLKDLDFVYQSLSSVIINRYALAWTRFIQPPLRHFPIQTIEAERRAKYRVTSARRQNADDISTAPAHFRRTLRGKMLAMHGRGELLKRERRPFAHIKEARVPSVHRRLQGRFQTRYRHARAERLAKRRRPEKPSRSRG